MAAGRVFWYGWTDRQQKTRKGSRTMGATATAHRGRAKAPSTEGRANTEQERPALDRMTYSIQEAADLLGIGRSLAYQLSQEGTLPGVRRLGRRYVVSRAGLDAWLESPQR